MQLGLSSHKAEFYSFFGSGPHYRWLDYGGIDQETLNNRVRNAPVTPTPEDGIRDLVGSGDGTLIWRNYDDLIKYLDGILDENPDIAGMVGYSEGACMASTYILNEEKRLRETGRERRIKCALFVTGTPPINPDKGFVLADEQEDVMLDVPTLHVIGANGSIPSPSSSVVGNWLMNFE
ncbi:Serine hydrolase FSH1 [Aspergillus sclerotialis]|uniref:Serine hydrolase FSH1 n=1 Tax=Aspergillus sclerotialis TaxID=2070753 RepID=A0A3A2ZMK2_9EURO|nr:Serine hydrolase FSH1 [Aspergillus sclerotialis]